MHTERTTRNYNPFSYTFDTGSSYLYEVWSTPERTITADLMAKSNKQNLCIPKKMQGANIGSYFRLHNIIIYLFLQLFFKDIFQFLFRLIYQFRCTINNQKLWTFNTMWFDRVFTRMWNNVTEFEMDNVDKEYEPSR